MVLFYPSKLYYPEGNKVVLYYPEGNKVVLYYPFQEKEKKANRASLARSAYKTCVCFLSIRVLSYVHHSDRKSTFLTLAFLFCLRNYYFPRILSIYPQAKEPPSDKSKESSKIIISSANKTWSKKRRFSVLVMK